jgi:hypothetical protein
LSTTNSHTVVITKSIEIIATDFTHDNGDATLLPADTFILAFSISFDNIADISNATDGLFISNASLTYDVNFCYQLVRFI